MHIVFSEEERRWIDKKFFNWSIKEGCPKDIRKKLQKKITLLKKEVI